MLFLRGGNSVFLDGHVKWNPADELGQPDNADYPDTAPRHGMGIPASGIPADGTFSNAHHDSRGAIFWGTVP